MKQNETKKENQMRKLGMLLLMVCLVLSSAFSNAQSEAPVAPAAKENVKLEFFCWGAAEATTSAAFKAMIEGFEAKYPWIKVEVTTSNYDGVNSTLRNRIAAGDAPDVAQVSDQWVATYHEMGGLLPLSDVLSADTLKDFYAAQKVGTTYDGKLYSAPWIMQPCELYYNKDLLAAAGVDKVPATWQEVQNAAVKIAALGKDASGNKIYGRSLNSKLLANAGYGSLPDVWGYGGDVTDANGKVVFNSKETITAYTNLQNLVKAGVVPQGLQIVDCRTLFGNGQVGFHVDAPSQATNWKKINLGVIIIDTYSSNHHLIAGANTKHPKECALLIDYLTGPEGMALYNKSTFVIPSRTSVEGLDAYKNLSATMSQFVAGAATARALPVKSSGFVAAMEGIANGLQRIVINNEDVATVVADMDKMLKTYY